MKKKTCLLLSLIGVLELKSVLGYIDPGTGGLIATSVWPFVVGILGAVGAFCAKYFYRPVKSSIVGVWQKIKR